MQQLFHWKYFANQIQMSHPFSLVKTDSDWTERRDSKLTKKMLSQKKKKKNRKEKKRKICKGTTECFVKIILFPAACRLEKFSFRFIQIQTLMNWLFDTCHFITLNFSHILTHARLTLCCECAESFQKKMPRTGCRITYA